MDDTGERVAGDIRAAFPALITAMVKTGTVAAARGL